MNINIKLVNYNDDTDTNRYRYDGSHIPIKNLFITELCLHGTKMRNPLAGETLIPDTD